MMATAWYTAWRHRTRLKRFWDSCMQRGDMYRGWESELPALHHAVRKDGLAHIAAFARQYGGIHACRAPRAWVFPHSSDAWHATALAANHQANADSPDLWIYKPSTGSCGQGVVVGSAPVIAELLATDGVAGHAAVVQRYEASPRLIAGLKFDLRCYMVCVQNSASSRPTFYLYGDGLARFATQPYRDGAGTVPGGGALCHSQHLTNYTVNNTQPNTGWQGLRHSWFGVGAGDKDATATATSTATAAGTPAGQAGRFLESGDAAGVGGVDASGNILSHKWSAAEALLFLESDTGSAAAGEAARVHGLAKAAGAHPPLQPAPAPEPSWASIESLVAGVLVAVLDAPLARHGFAHAHAHAHATLGPPTSKAVSAPTAPAVAEMAEEEGVRRFELVGVDVMFDDSNTSHIIELQRRPDLSPTSPLDLRVKSELLQGLDAILDMHGQQCRGLNGPGDRDVSGLPGGWRRVALPECDFTLPDGSPLWKEWLRVDTALCDAMAAEKGAWAVAEKAIRDSAAFSNMR